MKRTILLLIMVLPMLAMIGCASAPSDGGETKEETEASPASEARLDLISLTYYFHHGSMAGMDYSYSIAKGPTETYLFHAEIQSEDRIVDREITQAEFDAIMQLVHDHAEERAEADAAGEEYTVLDANSTCFEATFADGQTQIIELGPGGSEVLSQLQKLLEESPDE